MNIEELKCFLRRHQIPFDLWSQGATKSIEHLLAELNAGEAGFTWSESGLLLRRISPIGINVFGTLDGVLMRLVEQRQVFPDGRVRVRKLSTSLGEKCVFGEPVHQAARRAALEELNVNIDGFTVTGLELRTGRVSNSFPGLLTTDELVTLRVEMPHRLVRPQYVETQPGPLGKRVEFGWQPVP